MSFVRFVVKRLEPFCARVKKWKMLTLMGQKYDRDGREASGLGGTNRGAHPSYKHEIQASPPLPGWR